jgi:NAD dependent epimerase/dehydratase family enzyme
LYEDFADRRYRIDWSSSHCASAGAASRHYRCDAQPGKARQVLGTGIDIWKNLAEQQNLDGFDAVINLAGEPIADKRWTEEQKQLLCSSRWNITEKLVELIRNSHTPPSVLISGSAVGYYGDLGEVVVTEEEPP